MGTKSREVIWGGRIMGASIRAQGARERAQEAVREADRAEAEAWSVRMEGYGGPAQPSPAIGQCPTADSAGWRSSAPAVRCAPACRLTPSADLEIRRSGNSKRHSSAGRAARLGTRHLPA